MSDLRYVQIRSWHIVLTPTRVPHRYRTMCGRTVTGPTVTTLPAGKSCETCLRHVTRSEDDGSTWTE